jgi:uncharacterized protein
MHLWERMLSIGMDIFTPIQKCADIFVYYLLALPKDSPLANSLNFFVYDSIKIIALLIIINYVMAVVRYYLPVEKIREILVSRNWYGLDYLLAAFFGVITPFCSCSSIPLFIGFVRAGVPLGVTFSFLITSPLVNEASLALFPALFGYRTTILYNTIGIVVGIVGGFIIHKLKMEKYINSDLLNLKGHSGSVVKKNKKLSALLKYWWQDGWATTAQLIPYVLIGIGVGAIIHGFIPVVFFQKYLSLKHWWTVPLATLVGLPLYANSVSVIPVMEVLINKGVSLGTALAFMSATVTLSIPEALILKKAMKIPLLLTFFGITTIGIMCIGYFFNFVS